MRDDQTTARELAARISQDNPAFDHKNLNDLEPAIVKGFETLAMATPAQEAALRAAQEALGHATIMHDEGLKQAARGDIMRIRREIAGSSQQSKTDSAPPTTAPYASQFPPTPASSDTPTGSPASAPAPAVG